MQDYYKGEKKPLPLKGNFNVHKHELHNPIPTIIITCKYILYNRMNNIFLNERACKGVKTEKAHEQDWDGTLATRLN